MSILANTRPKAIAQGMTDETSSSRTKAAR